MKILQTLRATTAPYANHVVPLGSVLTGAERLMRRLIPAEWAAGIEMFFRRNTYDVVVTADYRTALVFGALSRLFGRRAAHVVKELYLDEAVLQSSFRRAVFRRALATADCVITNCSAEVSAYGEFLDLSPDKIHFLPWPSNIPVQPNTEDEGYIFAAGRSFRDWPTLFAAARRVDARFVVVAEAQAVRNLNVPDNVQLCCDVSRDRYLELLGRAQIVVLPLYQTVRSIGQAALLEAMSFGKPIVCARTPGVADYIEEGETGVFYEPGNSGSLAEAVHGLIGDESERERLGRQGSEAIASRFNKVVYAEQMLELLCRIVGEQPTKAFVPAETEAACSGY